MIINQIREAGKEKYFRTVINILIFAFTITTCGCYTTKIEKTIPDSLADETNYHIINAVLKNGLVVNLKDKGAIFVSKYQDKKNVILFRTVDTVRDASGVSKMTSNPNILETKDILSLTVEKNVMSSAGYTMIVIGGIVVLAILAGIILSSNNSKPSSSSSGGHSCPFIYSMNGSKYIFDGEPYGGSVSEGLKKTDYSRLEQLTAVDGKYKLLMRNETEESQYTDEMKLLVVEHPVNTEDAPDISGKMSVFEKAFPPLSVTDENGKDITVFFNKRDIVQWQTDMQDDALYETEKRKHELIFKFPKPKNAKKVKLLVNAGTAQWGEYMIKKMLDIRGNKVDKWYEDINKKGIEMLKLYQFVDREELFILKANILENGRWINRGSISAGGPYIDEDRIIELNTENVTGDTLCIKLNPPYGYWKFDYAGVIYESSAPVKVTELQVNYAVDEKGKDLKASLSGIDGNYYSMPEMTNSANIEFVVPAPVENMKRSLFLKTTGYYEIHLKKDKPEQTELIEKIYNTPGLILEITMNEYIKKIKSLGLNDK